MTFSISSGKAQNYLVVEDACVRTWALSVNSINDQYDSDFIACDFAATYSAITADPIGTLLAFACYESASANWNSDLSNAAAQFDACIGII